MPHEQSVPRRAPQNMGDSTASTVPNPLQTPPPRQQQPAKKLNGRDMLNSMPSSAGGLTPRKELHGQGIEYTLPSGAKYVGDFHHGTMHGTGRYEYSNGDAYEGDFRHDKIHGYGTYVYQHGDEYTGEWQNGHRTGKGAYTFGHNGSVLVGWWRGDQPHGHGKLMFPDQQEPRYEGDWEDSMRHGLGVQRHPNGGCYDGHWDKGRENGMGVLQGADGSLYCGEWRAGQRDGHGIVIEHGVKYLVEFNFDYQTSRKQLPRDSKAIPSEFRPVHDYFLKWWTKTRGGAALSASSPGRNADNDVTALVVDRESYENVVTQRNELEKALAAVMESHGGGGAGAEDEENVLASTNNPEELKRAIHRLVEQRNVERQRAAFAEQKVVRLRMAGVDVDSAVAQATPAPATTAGAAASSFSSSRGLKTQQQNGASAASAAPSPSAGDASILREQLQNLESDLKAKETKLRDAERRNIAAQNSIDELQAEVSAAKLREKQAMAAAAASSSENPAASVSHRHRASISMTPKPQDADENSRLQFELARLKKELDDVTHAKDDAEKKYVKEKEKHKRASKERDTAKATLAVREQEAGLNERLFRIMGVGQALVLGVVKTGGAFDVSEDGKSIVAKASSGADGNFELDAVYNAEQMQDLEEEWVYAVTGVRNGYSCAMLLLGAEEGARRNLVSNLVPSVVKHLFGATTQMQGIYDVTISMSFVEVARQNVTDLLSQTESATGITIMKDARGTIAFDGATRQSVNSADDAVKSWSRALDQLQRRVSNKMLIFWVEAVDKASKATFHGKLMLADLCATTANNAPLVATESSQQLFKALAEAKADNYQHRGEPLLMALSDAVGGPTRTIVMVAAGSERSEATQTMLQQLSECRDIVNFPLQHFETPHALALQRYVAEKAPRELPPKFFPLSASGSK